MNRQKRKYWAIWLTLSVIFQSLWMPYIDGGKATFVDYSNALVTEYSIAEQYDGLMLQASTELSVVTTQDKKIGSPSIADFICFISVHLTDQLNTLFSLNKHIDVFFDIRKLKFPTHYFW